jgi:hypothetical protein
VPAWDDRETDRLAAALDRARAGAPTVLVIEGEAGIGKTALLTELVAQARDFQVLRADGLETDQTSYVLLAQWGVDPVRPSDGGAASTRIAAQAVQERLDSLALAGPVL